MAWLTLFVAGMLEVAWSVGLKESDGFSRWIPSAFTVVTMFASLWCLTLAMKALPLGTVYAVWTGIGAVGAAMFGALLFHEPVTPGRLLSIGLIVAGVVGLRLTAPV